MQNETLYVRSIALNGLPEFIEKLGGDSTDLFLKVGLNPASIKNGENFISWPKVCNLLELAAKELDEPQFGLKWALELPSDFQNSGPVVFLASLVPDVRAFIDLTVKYQRIHTNGVTYNLVEDAETNMGVWSIHMHPMTPSCRQISEHIMATTVQISRQGIEDLQFSRVCFQHSAPEDLTLYESLFKCPIIFNSPRLEVTTDRSYLDKKVGGSLKVLQPLLKLYLGRRKSRLPKSQNHITHLIMEVLPSLFGAKKSDAVSVAKGLNISAKKMQRLLKVEGTNFSDIRDDVRHQMTRRLLFESDISITHLANFLDYASNESFNTACKRWSGVSPRKYRKQLRRPEN